MHGKVAHVALKVALFGKRLELLRSVDGIGNHLTQEDFMVRIQKLFNDREYVFCRYSNVSFLHIFSFLNISFVHPAFSKHRAKKTTIIFC